MIDSTNQERERQLRMQQIMERAHARRVLNEGLSAERRRERDRELRRRGIDEAIAGLGYRLVRRTVIRLVTYGGLSILGILLGMEFLSPANSCGYGFVGRLIHSTFDTSQAGNCTQTPLWTNTDRRSR